ncbi:restriction endonuclease subunit S [Sphaerimonospora sp. CA-214678]|uniref:restriction endonuclease subunit S n=1 Tax=Sphaerimonospora sp. CA-214678 TaxID=3240029 RepID=UPI003D8E4CFF
MSGCPSVPIGEIVHVLGGGTPTRSNSDYYGGDIPWVTPKDMKTWDIRRAQIGITQRGLENSAARLVPENSVLIVVRSGVLKHTLPVGLNRVPVAINQDMKALVCSDDVDPNYLAHFIKGRSDTILTWVRATTADNFPIDNLKQLPIPLPSLDEQLRIVSLLVQADALRAKRREAITLLDDLAQSFFYNMFDDLATNARGWDDSLSLGDVAEVTSGITKGRKVSGALRPVPYMAVLNVQDKMLDLSVVKEIEATEAEIQRYRLLKDDLLLTEGGDPDKLGRGTLWQNELPEAIHQNHIFRVRLRPDSKVEPNFLNWLLASERGRRYFLRSAKQTTGIASINATQLRQFPLVVPPLVLQNEFAVRLGKIKAHKSTQQAHLAELDNLFASLQQRAFRGELWDTRDN